MSADLEQQLPRLAEALDREAPAISVDEILSRGTVAVDVDRLERPSWDQVPRVAAVSWGDAMPGHGENGERDASIELAPTAAEPPARRRVASEGRARGRGGRRVGRRPRGDRADRRRTRPCRRADVRRSPPRRLHDGRRPTPTADDGPRPADNRRRRHRRRRVGCGRSRRSRRCVPPRSAPTPATPTTPGRSTRN